MRQANACSTKLKELYRYPTSSGMICRVGKVEHEHGQTTKGRDWPALGKESVVRTPIQNVATAATKTVQPWASKQVVKIGAGGAMLLTDGLCSADGRVGAAAVCEHGYPWSSCHRKLGTGRMEVFDTEWQAIELVVDVTVEQRERLQRQ